MSPPVPPTSGSGAGNLLVAVSDDRSHAVVARQSRLDDRGSIHAVVLRADRLPLVLVEVGMPVARERWEFRGSGLWVEAVCETRGQHWSYGLEAFALAIDRPDELIGRGYGHRTPLGWELDFVVDETGSGSLAGGQEADPVIESGRVDGLLLTAPAEGGERPFAGRAWRGGWSLVSPDPWPVTLPAIVGQPIEVALPIDGVGADGPVWWVGHDGRSLTSRLTPG